MILRCPHFTKEPPQVVQQKGHGLAVDWWSLGVFIYELLSGKTPFARADPVDTYNQLPQPTPFWRYGRPGKQCVRHSKIHYELPTTPLKYTTNYLKHS